MHIQKRSPSVLLQDQADGATIEHNFSFDTRNGQNDSYYEHLIKQFEGIKYRSNELSIVSNNKNSYIKNNFLPHIKKFSSSVISPVADPQEQTLKNLLSIPIGIKSPLTKRYKSNLNVYNKNRRFTNNMSVRADKKASLAHIPSIPRLEEDLKFHYKSRLR